MQSWPLSCILSGRLNHTFKTSFRNKAVWGPKRLAIAAVAFVLFGASRPAFAQGPTKLDADLQSRATAGSALRTSRVIVTLAGSGTGSVSGPDGLDCPDACAVEYEPGSLVDLTANAASDSVFAGWSGPCEGLGACHLTMDGDKAVTATFSLRPFLEFSAAAYTVAEGGSATITVKRLISTVGTVMVDYAILPGSATAPPGPDPDYSIPQTHRR